MTIFHLHYAVIFSPLGCQATSEDSILTLAVLDFHTVIINFSIGPQQNIKSVASRLPGWPTKEKAALSYSTTKVWAPPRASTYESDIKPPSVHHSGSGTRCYNCIGREKPNTRSGSGKPALDFPSFIVTSSRQIRAERKKNKTHKAARVQKIFATDSRSHSRDVSGGQRLRQRTDFGLLNGELYILCFL